MFWGQKPYRAAWLAPLMILAIAFLSSCPPMPLQELMWDDGTTDGKKSMAGSGHAVKFQCSPGYKKLTEVSIYGMRYGQPADSMQYSIYVLDGAMNEIARFQGNYQDFPYATGGWWRYKIDPPVKVPSEFWVCYAFNPHMYYGVYVFYDNSSSGNSRSGTPGNFYEDPGYNWMIRCKVR